MSDFTNRFVNYRLASGLIFWIIAACSGYTALILYTASAQEALDLARNFPAQWSALGTLPIAFTQLRRLLTGLAILGGLLGMILMRGFPPGTLPYASWRNGGRQLWVEILGHWRALQPRQRHWALAILFFLTALRIGASWVGVNVDDMASYEYFVRKSLFTVIAYYPAPNNHLFSNVISWFFYQVYPGYWWSMRVPVLLLSTLGTIGWFLGLLHHTNFRVAALTITLFSLLETSLFAAALGRGYTLIMIFSGLGFFSMLLLSRPGPAALTIRRAGACAGLVVAGILGLYAVPTFAYFLVGAYSWLGMRWWRRPAYLAGMGLLGVATLLGATLLYAPLLLVSGHGSLFHNQYVEPLAIGTFLRQLPTYSWQLEGGLMGQSTNGMLASWHVGSLAAAFVLAGFSGLTVAARSGQLARLSAAPILRIGIPALWMLSLPYLLLLAQRVQPPGRTMGFKAVFLFLLVGLEVDWLLATFGHRVPALRKWLLVGVGLWAGIEVGQLYRSNELRLSYHRTPHLVAQWLLRQPSGPILAVGAPWYLPFISFYFHFEDPTATLVVDDKPRAGVRYRYLIGPPTTVSTLGTGRLQLHIPPDTNCEAVDIIARW